MSGPNRDIGVGIAALYDDKTSGKAMAKLDSR
jgi:hypothetical protein